MFNKLCTPVESDDEFDHVNRSLPLKVGVSVGIFISVTRLDCFDHAYDLSE